MENYQIVSYRQQYLSEIIEGWNSTLVYDPVSEKRFLHQILLDENFDRDLALVLLIEGKVSGFCYAVKRKYPYLTRGTEKGRGWINILYVLPAWQRKGYGSVLLKEAEARLKRLQTEEITLCAYSPNYFTPGVDLKYESAIRFFDKYGYTRGLDAVSMQRNLFTYQIPDYTVEKKKALEAEGIQFRQYTNEYMERLLEFTDAQFGAGWVLNICQAIKKNEAEESILIATDRENRVIGYCMRKIDGNDARFGPIGVKQELQSKGIGGVLFDLQMRKMQEKGIYYAYFLWTHGDAVRFYERHKMSVYRTYQLYKKKISTASHK